MTEKEKEEIQRRVRWRYKKRVRELCKLIGIDSFGNREMLRLMNRLMLIAGGGIADRDLHVIVRLYNRELIGRREIGSKEQKELLT